MIYISYHNTSYLKCNTKNSYLTSKLENSSCHGYSLNFKKPNCKMIEQKISLLSRMIQHKLSSPNYIRADNSLTNKMEL